MDLMVNPVITDFQQDVNGDIKMLKLGANKEDAWANIAEQGASAKLDNNKSATINVSTYTEPVVINPTSGKDGMKKATITLSNIPSPSGSNKLYGWEETDEGIVAYTSTPNPTTSNYCIVDNPRGILHRAITEVGEDTITVVIGEPGTSYVFTRDNTLDVDM